MIISQSEKELFMDDEGRLFERETYFGPSSNTEKTDFKMKINSKG